MARLEQKQSLRQSLSPNQILQARLLQLNSLSFEAYILNELESNPVLESVDQGTETEQETIEEEDNSLDMDPIDYDYEIIQPKGEQKNLLDLPLPDNPDFVEILVKQLDDYSLSSLERSLCEEIIWNIDERGYLDIELTMIADRFDLNEEDLFPILNIVQNLEPKGIGSRNLKECLLVQLNEDIHSLPYLIVLECYDDFIHKRFEKIENYFKCTRDELKAALKQIGKLNPHPGEGKIAGRETVIPDLIIYKREGKWVIRTNDKGIPELVINEMYKDLSTGKSLVEKDKKYLKERVESAGMLIEAVKQRRHTLTAVMESIIRKQPTFFNGDIEVLEPMKLQDIADEINVDISTVSRSTRGKYVDTPFGIFELKSFFSATVEIGDGIVVSNRKAKQSLKELIDNEDKNNPVTDEEILSLMKDRGFPLARRTIAKYREQLNIPVARLRRII